MGYPEKIELLEIHKPRLEQPYQIIQPSHKKNEF